MAIDVFVCTSLEVANLQAVLERIRSDHPDVFPRSFHTTDAFATSELNEIFMRDEFGFHVTSEFILGLNDKRSPHLAKTVDLVKSYFEKGTVLTVFDGREAFPPWPLGQTEGPSSSDTP